MKPIRLQLSRTKGFDLQALSMAANGRQAAKVTRPGKYGNPFDFRSADCSFLALSYGCRGDRLGRQEASVKAFREWVTPAPARRMLVRMERGVRFGNDRKDVQIGPRFIVGPPPAIDAIRADLGGRNLACWCKLGDPCHAEVLLELANQ